MAQARLEQIASRPHDIGRVDAPATVRQAVRVNEIAALIAEDEDVALLGPSTTPGLDGPGRLVAATVGKSVGAFTIPVAIVPGGLAT